jgi:hypothetical protein
VTDGIDDSGVDKGAGPVAVCVIRLEHQSDGPLIALRLTLDINSTSGERRMTFIDLEEALAAVREFIERFSDNGHLTAS